MYHKHMCTVIYIVVTLLQLNIDAPVAQKMALRKRLRWCESIKSSLLYCL